MLLHCRYKCPESISIFLVIKFPLFKNHSRLSSNVTIVTLDSAHHLESSLTPEQAVEKDIILCVQFTLSCTSENT